MLRGGAASGPLRRKKVLVVSSASKLGGLAEALQRMGAHAIPFPTIEMRPIQDQAPLDSALAALKDYSWVIFTSTHGVLFFLKRMEELGYSPARWHGIQVCAVGPATAAALRNAGILVALVPEQYLAEGLDVFAYFNNDAHGHAVQNAADLRRYARGNATGLDAAMFSKTLSRDRGAMTLFHPLGAER